MTVLFYVVIGLAILMAIVIIGGSVAWWVLFEGGTPCRECGEKGALEYEGRVLCPDCREDYDQEYQLR